MRLCVVRHGLAAERGPGIDDDARPLTPEGRARTREAARGIRKLKLVIDGIWTSPLPRALQTAEILARELGLPAPKLTDLLRPDGLPGGMSKLLRELKGECPAIVGHEPDLGAAVARLTGARPDAYPMKKAGLAVVDLTRKGAGALALFVTPAILRALSR